MKVSEPVIATAEQAARVAERVLPSRCRIEVWVSSERPTYLLVVNEATGREAELLVTYGATVEQWMDSLAHWRDGQTVPGKLLEKTGRGELG